MAKGMKDYCRSRQAENVGDGVDNARFPPYAELVGIWGGGRHRLFMDHEGLVREGRDHYENTGLRGIVRDGNCIIFEQLMVSFLCLLLQDGFVHKVGLEPPSPPRIIEPLC